MKISRREFIKGAGAVAALALTGAPAIAQAAGRRVIIIGGGIGGATAARYLRQADPTIEITLIEAKRHYHTASMSNEILAGERSLQSLRFDYAHLIQAGITIIHDLVTTIDTKKRQVITQQGSKLAYDRCILAPGIDFRWQQIAGYNTEAAQTVPHAWQAGKQTTILQQQLRAMPDGGRVVITAPEHPMRCPVAVYERASLIAHYLKQQKPKSKIIILDSNSAFPNQALFIEGWKKLYDYGTNKSLIEWRSGSAATVLELDAKNRRVTSRSGETLTAEVLNIIPPQQAGKIAVATGLIDSSGWCPVNLLTFESTIHNNIHVIGDAAIASEMPKSGYATNSQAKVCAAAVAALLKGESPGTPSYIDSSYSIIGSEYAVTETTVYRLAQDHSKITRVAGGSSPPNASAEQRRREYHYAHSWYNNFTRDVFG